MRPLAGRLYQPAHALRRQPGRDGFAGGMPRRHCCGFDVGLVGEDRFWRSDLVRGRCRGRLPDGNGANDGAIIATIDVVASRMCMLGHVPLPFLANRSQCVHASRSIGSTPLEDPGRGMAWSRVAGPGQVRGASIVDDLGLPASNETPLTGGRAGNRLTQPAQSNGSHSVAPLRLMVPDGERGRQGRGSGRHCREAAMA